MKYLSALAYLVVAARKFSAFTTSIHTQQSAPSNTIVPAGEYGAKVGESLPFIYLFQEVMPERVKT